MKQQLTHTLFFFVHTQGKSVSHPCHNGVYDDPIEQFGEQEIEANSEEEAEGIAWFWLRNIVNESKCCRCSRGDERGSDSWWESVVPNVTETGFIIRDIES